MGPSVWTMRRAMEKGNFRVRNVKSAFGLNEGATPVQLFSTPFVFPMDSRFKSHPEY